jgi:hypothetical protein
MYPCPSPFLQGYPPCPKIIYLPTIIHLHATVHGYAPDMHQICTRYAPTYTVKKAYAYLAFSWVFATLRVETSILDAGIFLSSSTVFIYIPNTGKLFQSVEGALFHLSE